ncbi:hypothetical protein K461DRAFT_273357 [Myriangium duriaei CBS 260.36]|uniref:Zinc finger C2H2 LYAR-type domain-containing protein n=1 Tax=Myriangium duriaei CBS 260.36 TaxID=1168546 RepID=A0A9P4MS59_9PEZI|nr:hypothetical protein K461DRAFT_273357 [Myriangium duriaei CBS 260.36]
MVSFQCESCGDVFTKGKLDKHRGQCRGASFTCLDCMVHFQGTSYKSHTSCMSEAQKYEGNLYKEKGQKGKSQQTSNPSKAMIPRKAYVEDEQDTEMGEGAVAVVEVPPRAPSPPPLKTDDLPPGTNVYDFLVKEDRPGMALSRSNSHLLDTQASTISNDSHFREHGYSYGDAPLHPGMDRYNSYSSLVPHAGSQGTDSRDNSQQYRTPGPNRDRGDRSGDDRKSDKKRKRNHMDELDISRAREVESSATRPALHSGLTGGLSRLLSRPVEELERQAGLTRSPLSAMKRSKKDEAEHRRRREERNGDSRARREHRHDEQRRKEHRRRRDSSSSEEDRRPKHKAIEYHNSAADASNNNSQLVQYRNPAELFLSFINKGPESERGMSINKALKRYHRERAAESDRDRDNNDKDLWKDLRLRRNERGEIVLFSAAA